MHSSSTMRGRGLVITGALLACVDGMKALDLVIEGGKITQMTLPGEGADQGRRQGIQVFDANGLVVSPAFFDLHTHTRFPGDPESESPSSVDRAAAMGGYGTLVAMANTDPVVDTLSKWRDVSAELSKLTVSVIQASAITLGRRGEQLVDMVALAHAGVKIFTDDGSGLQRADLMAEALRYSSRLGVVVAQHSEEESLFSRGVMNEGEWSLRLGLRGAPEVAESAMVARDIELLKVCGGQLHVLHVSARESISLIRAAKAQGMNITCEVTPHHLLLTDELLCGFDPNFKVNPPLRSDDTRLALVRALREGDFDALATDHAPHASWRKELPMEEAPYGMLGLETAFGVAWTSILDSINDDLNMDGMGPSGGYDIFPKWAWEVAEGKDPKVIFELWKLLARMSWKPADIVGMRHDISISEPADLVLVDPYTSYSPDVERLMSRSVNLPYLEKELCGKVVGTLLEGQWAYLDGEVISER